jgi:hypothetical protein
MGIPKNSVVEYELALKTDKFLLIVHDKASEIEKARNIIATTPVYQCDTAFARGGSGREITSAKVEGKDNANECRVLERSRNSRYRR